MGVDQVDHLGAFYTLLHASIPSIVLAFAHLLSEKMPVQHCSVLSRSPRVENCKKTSSLRNFVHDMRIL